MLIELGTVRTWLYTSSFTQHYASDHVEEMVKSFKIKNDALELSGFLITDGEKLMQLLEGDENTMDEVRDKILADNRHNNIVSEVYELEQTRAFPSWSMRNVAPENYETLYPEITSAKYQSIATNIAKMLFDVTFDPGE